MRTPKHRQEKFARKVDGDITAARITAQRAAMIKNQGLYQADLAGLEIATKRIIEKAGISPVLFSMYRSFSEEMYRISKQFTSATRTTEATLITAKWASRGGSNAILTAIQALYGFAVVPPPPPPFCPFSLFDDFEDGKYESRTNPPALYPGCVYPEWVVSAGTWDASANYLRAATDNPPAPTQIFTPCSQQVGTWGFDFTFEATTGASGMLTIIMYIDADNNYFIYMDTQGNFYLYSYQGGGGVPLILTTWVVDLNEHTVTVTRTAEGLFELFLDGDSYGTTTDTGLSGFVSFGLGQNTGSPRIRFDNVEVTP